jgi:ClpP class serine protease
MAKRIYLPSFFLRANNLLVTKEQYLDALMNFALEGELQSYKDKMDIHIKSMISNPDIPITREYASTEIEHDAIAYYPIFGFITADSRWCFSSKQFESDLKDADANPCICVHFVHINSGGGEGWYLDRLSETMKSLTKPIYVLIEKACASAAYYIGCHGTKVMALTQNDIIGCIGVMCQIIDPSKFFEDMGIKIINLYAEQSDLKNKKYDDILKGKPNQFIQDELNPMAAQFINEVRSSRTKFTSLKDDDPILRGETYTATASLDNGLIDGITVLNDALMEARQIGINSKSKNKVYNMFNN